MSKTVVASEKERGVEMDEGGSVYDQLVHLCVHYICTYRISHVSCTHRLLELYITYFRCSCVCYICSCIFIVRCSVFFFFFFFSSRRRHTRLVSDWSSDVCSSD